MGTQDIEIQIKNCINSDFESNLFLKLKEFTAFVASKSKISNKKFFERKSGFRCNFNRCSFFCLDS